MNQPIASVIIRRLDELEAKVKRLESDQADPDPLLSTSEVCLLLNVHQNTWANWRRQYPKPPTAMGTKTAPRFRKSSVLRFAAQIGKFVKEPGCKIPVRSHDKNNSEISHSKMKAEI